MILSSFAACTLQSFVTRNCSRLSLKRRKTLLYARGFRQDEIRKLLQFRETETDRFIYIISLTAAFEDRWAQAFILIEYKWTGLSNACQTASLQNTITKSGIGCKDMNPTEHKFLQKRSCLHYDIGNTSMHLKAMHVSFFGFQPVQSRFIRPYIYLFSSFVLFLKSNQLQKLSALNPKYLLSWNRSACWLLI